MRNIAYLERESEALLNRVASEKMDQKTAEKEIDVFTENYKKIAEGDNKFNLLADAQKHLTAAIYKTVNDKEVRDNKKRMSLWSSEKKKYEDKIKELEAREEKRKKGQGCCSDCMVM